MLEKEYFKEFWIFCAPPRPPNSFSASTSWFFWPILIKMVSNTQEIILLQISGCPNQIQNMTLFLPLYKSPPLVKIMHFDSISTKFDTKTAEVHKEKIMSEMKLSVIVSTVSTCCTQNDLFYRVYVSN